MKNVSFGQRVLCNGFEGSIAEVHDGQLKGMATVYLDSGSVCVDITDLESPEMQAKAIKLYNMLPQLEQIDTKAAFAVRLRIAELNHDMGVTMADTAQAAETGYWRPKQAVA